MYWLRPENAILSTVLANKLNTLECNGDVIDLSCGDGTFMAVMMGGEFADDFDIFSSTSHLDKVKTNNADVYDYIDPSYSPQLKVKPSRSINYGLDIKPSMLHKARALNIYESLIEADVNVSIALPNNAVDTIYINHTINSYADLVVSLSEIYRILKPQGHAYISVYDKVIIDYFAGMVTRFPLKFSKRIERGLLSGFFRQQHNLEGWTSQITKAGFDILNIHPLISKEFVPYWCIGMRPIAPSLIMLVNSFREYDANKVIEIKNEWVELFQELAQPFLGYEERVEDSATYLFELSK